MTAKLRETLARYLQLRDAGGPEAGWAGILKYYQYLVRAVMTDPDYGIGHDGNGRGLLLYHQMGLGKTRMAVAVAMSMWDVRPPVVLLARGLQKNFKATVAEVVALLHPAAPPEELARLQAAAVARFAFVSMDAFNAAAQLDRAGAKARPGDAPGPTSGGLDGKLLVCDEAHNLFRAIINSSAEGANARRIYEAVMAARNLRIVFLTGSPAAKDPFELVPCFNMLAGADLLPPQYETFNELYVDRAGRAVKNRGRLANRLAGLVSCATLDQAPPPGVTAAAPGAAAPPDRLRPRDEGWFPEEFPTVVEQVEMDAAQYRLYLFAREKEDAEGKAGEGRGAERSARVMSAPPLALPGSEKKSMRSYFVKSRVLSLFADTRLAQGARLAALPDEAFSAAAGPKLARAAELVADSPGCALVYSQFVAAGLEALGRFLQLRGYARFAPDAPGGPGAPAAELPPAKRFAIISGDVASDVRDAIVALATSPANARGELLQALLVSKTGAEGLDLKCIRTVVILEPYWDKGREDQVRARAGRLGSHDRLPRAERDVRCYLLVAVANRELWERMREQDREPETIDEVFHRKALARYETNQAFRTLLAEASLDCTLYGRANCRVCVPTDAPLFRGDPSLDARLADPCESCSGSADVDATPLEVEGVTYYFTADPAGPGGYAFYAPRPDLGGFVLLASADPAVPALLAALGKK